MIRRVSTIKLARLSLLSCKNGARPVFKPTRAAFSSNSLRQTPNSGAVDADDKKINNKNSPDFDDFEASFHTKSIIQLFRANFVYTIATSPFIVSHSDTLLSYSYKILGARFTNIFMKQTFFGHFCAGEDENTIQPTVKYLKRNGIGSILDYAAEVDPNEAQEQSSTTNSSGIVINKPEQSAAANSSNAESNTLENLTLLPPDTDFDADDKNKARIYPYHDEELCDAHMDTFDKCIRAVRLVSPTGFAAIKLTALGNPTLIKRMSVSLQEIKNLFKQFDKKGTGIVSKEDFIEMYQNTFNADSKASEEAFNMIDLDLDERIDYIEWSNNLLLENIHSVVKSCKNTKGPLASSALDNEEIILMRNMHARVQHLASIAKELGVRLMIDAEHTHFQPAIDNITLQLQKEYNKENAVIFNTYQMYLKNSSKRLSIDVDRSVKSNYFFAAKLVRGAYMMSEREQAIKNKMPDPIHDTLSATHDNYNAAVKRLVQEMGQGKNIELMIASHNQESVEVAIQEMANANLEPDSGVYFGQLLGMADHLTFSLGRKNYRAYKYVPYGHVHEVMPYLIRRLQENVDVLSNARHELVMIRREIMRRINIF